MIESVLGFIISVVIINIVAIVLESPCRFGWYNKKDEERGRRG